MGWMSLALIDRAYSKQSTSALCYHRSQQGQAGNGGPQRRTAESLRPDTASLWSPCWARLFICFAPTSPAHIFQPLLQRKKKKKREGEKKKDEEYSKISYWETSLEGNWNELWRSHQLPDPLHSPRMGRRMKSFFPFCIFIQSKFI